MSDLILKLLVRKCGKPCGYRVRLKNEARPVLVVLNIPAFLPAIS